MKVYKILGLFLVGTMVAQVNDGPIDVTASGIVPFVVSFNTQTGDGGEDTGVDATTTAGDFTTVSDDDYDRATAEGVTNYFIINRLNIQIMVRKNFSISSTCRNIIKA